MKVINIDLLLDGGSVVIHTDVGYYLIDRRISTSNYGRVFLSDKEYDYKSPSYLDNDVVEELCSALEIYRVTGDSIYCDLIPSFVKDMRTP